MNSNHNSKSLGNRKHPDFPSKNSVLIAKKKPTEKTRQKEKGIDWNDDQNVVLEHVVIIYSREWRKIQKRLNRIFSKTYDITFLKERYQNLMKKKNYLKRPFDEREDQILLETYQRVGSDWIKISQTLSNRCPLMIKNRFYYLLRKQKNPN